MRGLMGERLLKHFIGGNLNRPELIPADEPKSEPTNGKHTGAKPKRAEEDGQLKTPEPIVPKASPSASNDGSELTSDMPFHTDMVRWNPFRNRAARPSDRERLFGDYWRIMMGNLPFDESALAIDVHEDDHAYFVTIELPGVQQENIHVNLEGDYLLIEGKIPEETVKKEGRRTLGQERRCRSFRRAIRLPPTVDSSKSEAKFENGTLTLTLPKVAAATSRTIPIKDSVQ